MDRDVDVSTRVSGTLSTVIESVLNAVEDEELVTLAMVRFSMERGLVSDLVDAGRLPPGSEYVLLSEIEMLIDEYGEDTPAVDFQSVEASEALSRLIEAELEGYDEPGVPTLGSIHASMLQGLTARMIGEGVIDPDDEQTLLAEIEVLVDRFGEDAPAEHYLRYE